MSVVVFYIIIFLLYFVLPLVCALCVKSDILLKRISKILLFCFIIMLIMGVCFDVNISDKVIIKPNFSGEWFKQKIYIWPASIFDFLINIVMLMPIGIYISFNAKKNRLLKSLLWGLVIGFTIEITQLIFPLVRGAQLSDALLNAVSLVLGCLYGMLLIKLRNKRN